MQTETLVSEIEKLDQMAEDLSRTEDSPREEVTPSGSPSFSSEEPTSQVDTTTATEAERVAAMLKPAMTPEEVAKATSQPSILPSAASILESISSSLDLMIHGLHSKVKQGNLQEDADQLAPLSALSSKLKQAKAQADSFLGKSE